MVTNTLGSALGVEPNSLPVSDKKPIDISRFDPKNIKTPEQALSLQFELAPKLAETKTASEGAKYDVETQLLGAKGQAADQAYTDMEAKINERKQKELEFPSPEFHPTQENAASIGSLFSLVSTLGVMLGSGGKHSAMLAMNGMTGMLKGWKEGRKDLYEKELKEYEKNFTRIKQIRDDLRKDVEDYFKLAPLDKERALAIKEEIIRKAGRTSVIGTALEKERWDIVNDIVQSSGKILQENKKIQSEANNRTLRMQEMMLAKIDREVLNESRAYPNLKMSDLTNISKEGTKRIVGSLEQLRETEHVVDFIEKNPNSVGAMAKLKNIINLDAINSINTGNEFNDAITRSATIDKNIDDAQNKGKISRSDAQAAKILQKQLFTLALADVQSSGQRGTVYLDKQFATLYDQASSLDTLIKILHQREISADRRLSVFGMDIKNRNDKNEEFKFYQTGPDQWLNQKFPVYTLDEAKKVVKNKSASPGSWYRGTDSVLRQF